MEDIGKVVPSKPIWPKRPEEENRHPPPKREPDDQGESGGEPDEQPQTPQPPGEQESDGHIDVFV